MQIVMQSVLCGIALNNLFYWYTISGEFYYKDDVVLKQVEHPPKSRPYLTLDNLDLFG